MIKTLNDDYRKYINFINVLTEVLRNCCQEQYYSILLGNSVYLSSYHRLIITEVNRLNGRYKILLERNIGVTPEYIIVSDVDYYIGHNPDVKLALASFYEELAFLCPEENCNETINVEDTLDKLFQTYKEYVYKDKSSSYI